MRYTANVALIIKGDRIRRGDEIELSAEDAALLDANDITPMSDSPAPEPEPEADVSLEEMSLPQLKERAKELGLATSGSKADLQERITLHLDGATNGDDEEEGDADGE